MIDHPGAIRCLCLALLAGAPVLAQQTWVVDPVAGPGVHFTDIPPAVAAAAPGDRIEVRGSTVSVPTYSPFVVSKSLDIEAVQGASVYYFRVENLPAGGVVRVAGLHCEPRPTYLTPDDCVLVRNCQGTVLLAGLEVWTRTGDYYDGFIVRDAATVAIQDCRAVGRDSGLIRGGAALVVERSGVSIVRTALTGGRGGSTASNAAGFDGGAGVSIVAGSLLLADCTLVGGDGGYGWAFSGTGGDGVLADPLGARPMALAGCTIVRGLGLSGMHGDAVDGPVRIDANCILTGPLTNGAVQVAALPGLTAPAALVLGGVAQVACSGTPGAVAALAFDLQHGHQTVPGIAEPLLLSPGLAVGAIGVLAGGSFVWNLPLPNSPLLQQRDLFFQAATGTGTGPVQLTPLAVTRLR